MIAPNPEQIVEQFKQSICSEVELHPMGIDRYAVFVPFMFDDGDHYVVNLRAVGDGWELTDDGHTFMHMSYGNVEYTEGTRRKIIEDAIASHNLTEQSGVLSLLVPDGRFGDALFSFIHAIAKIVDVTKITKEVAKSTFYEDFARLITEVVPEEFRQRNWVHNDDPQGHYVVDYFVDAGRSPWLIFGVHSDSKCSDVTISCLYHEKHFPEAESLVLFENQETISRRKLAQLSDAVGKQFSSFSDRNRIAEFLRKQVLPN